MKPKFFNSFVLPAIALGALAMLATSCSRGEAQPTPPPPPTVTVAPVEQQSIVEWNEFTGRVQPVNSVEVRPRVSGYIQEVRFQSGQLVKKGDVLFVIDPRWNQAAYDERKAQYDQARSEADRVEKLLTNNAISAEEAEARSSRAEVAKAALDSARLDLDYTEVRSPIDGRVSRALLTEGNYVNGDAGGATMLTTVVSVDPVYVYADIDEDTILRFNRLVASGKLGNSVDGNVPVELELADETNFPHKGHIESFDNQLNPDTGSILLRAVFQNDNGRILPGLFARIRIPLSEKHEAILVDERAVGTDQAQKFVLTLSPTNTVQYQTVDLGPLVDGKRVVRSGLAPGQKIVMNVIMAKVRPGMSVTPQTGESNGPASDVKVARR